MVHTKLWLVLGILVFLPVTGLFNAAWAEVIVQRTPDGGLQPRLVQDAEGTIHLLYFKKRLNRPAAREGNLYYRQYDSEENQFGLPVKVSSQAFAIQTFSIAMSVALLQITPERFRGRIMGVRMLAVYGMPLGLLGTGVLVEWYGFAITVWLYAVIGILCTVWITWRWRRDIWR